MAPSTFGFALGLLLTVASAHAAVAQGIDFDFQRGPGAERCPDRGTLARRVAKHLGKREPRAQVAERVAVSIERSAEGYVGTVSVAGDEDGMRHFLDKGEDCAGLAEALSLALAMIADGKPVTEVEPRVASRVARPWEIGAAALGSTGMLGAASLGAGVQVAWQPWPRLTTSLVAFWLPGRSIAVEQSAAEITLAAGLANVCLGLLPYGGRVYPALCGQLGAGALHGAGQNLVGQRSAWRPWLAAGGSVSVGVRLLQRWTLAVSAGRLLSLKDEQFVVGGHGPVYDSGSPGWLGQVGLRFRIP